MDEPRQEARQRGVAEGQATVASALFRSVWRSPSPALSRENLFRMTGTLDAARSDNGLIARAKVSWRLKRQPLRTILGICQ
jgi:hypothetical protein